MMQELSYDAWGRQRDPSSFSTTVPPPMLGRGYGGHEYLNMFGLVNMNARFYDGAIGRFTTQDPLAEKYYSISPYAYCNNNPVNLIDPTGRDIFILGSLNQEALQQLQSRVGNSIILSMNDKGKVTYSANTDKKLKGDALRMTEVINDNSITVNIGTTSENISSTGNLFAGGMFMGNVVSKDADGNVAVSAFQEVNPNVLGVADGYTETPGKMMMHEVTEAYEGAKISQEVGVGIGPATRDEMNSVYMQAHERVTPQSTIKHVLYDENGRKLNDSQISRAVKIEWKVISSNGIGKVIQSYP